MSKVQNAWRRIKGWFTSDGSSDQGGPGGGTGSQAYHRARAEGEFARFRDSGFGSGGGSI